MEAARWGCFSSRGIGKLIAISGIIKSEDYVKIPEENLQLSVQNLDLGRRFTLPYLPSPSTLAGYDTRLIFKRSLPSLNSKFSFF